MTAPKSRSPWQVALVTGWESISKLTEDTQAHNVFVIHVGSGVWPAMKKLKDYSDDAAGRSFNNLNEKLECRYFDPTDDSYKTTNIESIMSKYIHERAIIVGGSKHTKKLYLLLLWRWKDR